MYVYDFLCTYHQHDDKDCDDMYRSQYLQAFGTNKWDDDIIDREIQRLYNMITSTTDINDILSAIRNNDKFKGWLEFLKAEDIDVFKILFTYDLFYLAHRCFCDILDKGIIQDKNRKMLIDNI